MKQRQEGQRQRSDRHADHVAEIGAGGDGDVFQRVGEGLAPLLDAGAHHVEIVLQQHEIGRLLGDVDRLIDRDADIGSVQRGSIVDAVAEIADHVAALLQRQHDPLLLVRIDLGENVGALGHVP